MNAALKIKNGLLYMIMPLSEFLV